MCAYIYIKKNNNKKKHQKNYFLLNIFIGWKSGKSKISF